MKKKPDSGYGAFAAKRAAQRAADRRAAASPKERKARRASELATWPLDGYEPSGSQSGIDWSDASMLAAAEGLVGRMEGDGAPLMQMLVLGTGFGKTAIAVAAMGMVQEAHGGPIPFVVAAPRAVVDGRGWHETISSYNAAHPGNAIRPYCIETYERLSSVLSDNAARARVLKEAGSRPWVVVDECHAYKNPTSKRAKALARLAGARKIGLTATPLTNDPVLDMCSYLVMAGFYRNKTHFLEEEGLKPFLDGFYRLKVYRADGSVDERLWPGYAEVRAKLARVIWQPTVEAAGEMPGTVEVLHQLPPDESLDADMASLAAAWRARMFDSAADLMTETCARVACDAARLDKCVELCRGASQPLVFFWHTSARDALVERFAAEGVVCQVLDGEHPMGGLDMDDLSRPILVQYRAGAEGVEFKASDTTVFYENQFSYTALKQAKGRNVRRGQDVEEVRQHHIVSACQFDSNLFYRVRAKEEVNEAELAEMAVESMPAPGKW